MFTGNGGSSLNSHNSLWFPPFKMLKKSCDRYPTCRSLNLEFVKESLTHLWVVN